MNRTSLVRSAAVSVAALLIGIQSVPVDKTDKANLMLGSDFPPPEGDFQAPEEVLAILKTSCFDCHSNETVWPWYSHVAPVSWLLAKHVREGREELNFSYFTTLPPLLRAEVWKEVRNDNMPMKNYTFMHPDSKLTDSQKEVLRAWSQAKPATANAQSE